jgi:riboflavin kinase/FMN adenylyltransferase
MQYSLVLHHLPMIVHNSIAQLPVFTNAIVTIGTFDGVHTGHQQIIRLMNEEAAKVNGETVIITFHPHPRKIVSGGESPVLLLNTLEERIELLAKAGIDHLVITPFDEAFAEQSAEAYIKEFLVKTFHPHTIIVGYDHRFGKGRKGDYKLLEEKAVALNYHVKEIPVHMLEEVAISSTKIRTALLQGDIDTAANCLGYSYFFSGKVTEGNKLGRTIGYPTANIEIEDEEKLVPGNGVYAVDIRRTMYDVRDTKTSETIQDVVHRTSNIVHLRGMMNIGVRPTIDGTKRTIEINIFDFDETIYGEKLTIVLRKHLRAEKKFNGLEELKAQLAEDKKNSLAFFS